MSEEKKYMSTGSAPGTCCPEQKYVNGICSGCGHVRMSEAKAIEKYYNNYIKELEAHNKKMMDDFSSRIKELLNEIQYARKCNKSLSSRISKLNKIIDILK